LGAFPASPGARLGADASIRQAPEVLLVEAERFEVAGVQAPEEDGERLALQLVEGWGEAVIGDL
jgi:hypothetical protein